MILAGTEKLLVEEFAVRGTKKSEMKMALREQARRKVRPDTSNVGANRTYRDKVEAGRQNLLQISTEGGDSQAKKLKNELMYLLNNYLPSYDARIEHLIDSWRRTGDPAYDPSIRIRLRQARREFLQKSNPV
jgi:hypothetical protein